MKKVLQYLWQLPQNIVGLFLTMTFEHAEQYKDVMLARKSFLFNAAVSLGDYIIYQGNISQRTLKHEYGHHKQSLMLGPLYLIVIGLPSLIGNIVYRIHRFDYYKQPWEAWADKLGGVVRTTSI